MTKEKARTDITDLVRQTQSLFTLNGPTAPPIGQFVKMQEGMLEHAETFSRHWMERRQEALETGLEAMKEMSSTGKPDPAAAMAAIADWQRGSFERLTEDFREWMALCMQATQLAATTPQGETGKGDAASSGTGRGKAASRTRGRAASSGSKSDAASSGSKSDSVTPV